ncbi:MAG: hypothetical protein IKS59_03765 [Aeriscardovia sp.]|nr:hypothetical protein [Aeriscardovia sp.]
MTDKRDIIIRAIANELHISTEEVKNVTIVRSGEFYETRFMTDWMIYDCFVDDSTFEVTGIDSRPVTISRMLTGNLEKITAVS